MDDRHRREPYYLCPVSGKTLLWQCQVCGALFERVRPGGRGRGWRWIETGWDSMIRAPGHRRRATSP